MDRKQDIKFGGSETDEFRIIEFLIADSIYGINIARVREIVRANIDLIPLPDAHPSLAGVINLRGEIVPVVNLEKHLKVKAIFLPKFNRIIIMEFSGVVIGFLVSAVMRIHRVLAREVQAPSQLVQTDDGNVLGVVKILEKVIFLVDFEKILANINPKTMLASSDGAQRIAAVPFDRGLKKVLVVEDSPFVRKIILEHLNGAGYAVEAVGNGEEAWRRLVETMELPGFEKIEQHYNLLLTDIEMPQVDGLRLIRRVKDEVRLKRLPCISFSSMISKELVQKCKSAGSNGEISKSQINQLVAFVDSAVI